MLGGNQKENAIWPCELYGYNICIIAIVVILEENNYTMFIKIILIQYVIINPCMIL